MQSWKRNKSISALLSLYSEPNIQYSLALGQLDNLQTVRSQTELLEVIDKSRDTISIAFIRIKEITSNTNEEITCIHEKISKLYEGYGNFIAKQKILNELRQDIMNLRHLTKPNRVSNQSNSDKNHVAEEKTQTERIESRVSLTKEIFGFLTALITLLLLICALGG